MPAHEHHKHPWVRPPRLRLAAGERHATWLELFFDLTYVVAISALANLLTNDPSGMGLLRFAGLFVVTWWTWMAFTWYSSAFDSDDLVHRAGMFIAMLGIIALAVNIPRVASGHNRGFTLAFCLLHAALLALWGRAWVVNPEVRGFCQRYILGFAAALALWAISLLLNGPAVYVLWAIGIAAEMAGPMFAVRVLDGVRPYDLGHIAERYGLFVVIVLGESVVAVAAGITSIRWQPMSLASAAMAFLIAASFWWIYFEYVESDMLGRGMRLAFLWGYGHVFIFMSIIVTAIGAEFALHAAIVRTVLTSDQSLLLGGGIILFLAAVTLIQLASSHPLTAAELSLRGLAAIVAAGVSIFGDGRRPLVPLAIASAALFAATVYELWESGPGIASHVTVRDDEDPAMAEA